MTEEQILDNHMAKIEKAIDHRQTFNAFYSNIDMLKDIRAEVRQATREARREALRGN